MFILKHLKTLQHVSIIIQIIFQGARMFLVKVTDFTFLTNFKISDFNKEHTSSLKDDLNDDGNMLERF